MKSHNKVLLVIFLLCIPMLITACGSAPPIERTVTLHLDNVPDSAYYTDLLVSINENDDVYTSYNTDNGKKNGFLESDNYLNYNNDGYVSYSLHFKNAENTMLINGYKSNYSNNVRADIEFIPFDYPNFHENYNLLMEYSPSIKVVILNRNKEVISVSDIGTINSENGYLSGGITYDILNNKLQVEFYEP